MPHSGHLKLCIVRKPSEEKTQSTKRVPVVPDAMSRMGPRCEDAGHRFWNAFAFQSVAFGSCSAHEAAGGSEAKISVSFLAPPPRATASPSCASGCVPSLVIQWRKFCFGQTCDGPGASFGSGVQGFQACGAWACGCSGACGCRTGEASAAIADAAARAIAPVRVRLGERGGPYH